MSTWEKQGPPLIEPPTVSGLTPAEQMTLERLYGLWKAKLTRNRLRTDYYNGVTRPIDLGISILPVLRHLATSLGWGAKAVDSLAVRSVFEGFMFRGSDENPLAGILTENDFGELYVEAVTAQLTHSCAFITVSKGDVGEPPVIISAYSAMNAAALWDGRRKAIEAGMTVTKVGDLGQPTGLNLYLPCQTIELEQGAGGAWTCQRHPMPQSRPLMEPLRYRPSLDRPMGKSRISRAVMSLIDQTLAEMIRTMVAAEFFTVPQRYLLGATDEAIEKLMRERWSAYIGGIFAVSRDDSGDVPVYGQLPQMSFQPHLDYLRMYAGLFSGETGIPVASLGLSLESNPSSAEAIYAVREDLIIEAEALNRTNARSLRNVGLLAMAVDRGVDLGQLDKAELTLMPRFGRPDRPSAVSQSDAMVKQASVIPGLASTTPFLEALGWSEEDRQIIDSERRMAEGLATLSDVLGDGDL